jgi:hypothetical protein
MTFPQTPSYDNCKLNCELQPIMEPADPVEICVSGYITLATGRIVGSGDQRLRQLGKDRGDY